MDRVGIHIPDNEEGVWVCVRGWGEDRAVFEDDLVGGVVAGLEEEELVFVGCVEWAGGVFHY